MEEKSLYNLLSQLYAHLQKCVFDGSPLNYGLLEQHREDLCDALWLLGLEWENLSADQHASYSRIVEAVLARSFLTGEDCLAYLDEPVLEQCELISTAKVFRDRLNKLRTTMIYVQQKYNLMREEPEGYTRLLYSLNSPGKLEAAQELIGAYNLDPNRVIDLAIAIFEIHPEDQEFLGLLTTINTNALCHIFGFKFQNSATDMLPLAHIAALCIKNQLITLESIWGYLKPDSLAACLSDYQAFAQSIRRNMDIVVLNGDCSQQEQDLDIFNSPDLKNQKLAVLSELIRVNAWPVVKEVFERFQGKILVANYPPMVDALCDLIHWVVDPIYQTLPKPLFSSAKPPNFPAGPITQASSIIQALECLDTILPVLGASIGANTDTFIKACKILQHCEDKAKIIQLMKTSILPGLSLASNEVMLGLWKALQVLSYRERYDLYEVWKNHQEDGLVLVKQGITIKETRAWIKRLSRENNKQDSKSLLKFMNKSMCHVIKEMIFQVTSYNNLTTILINCFPHSNLLFLDVIPYSILQAFSTINKPKLERGGIAPWLKNIANFVGEFYKVNCKTELVGILTYVKESLKNSQVVEVCILREILTKMSGWNPPDKLTERMLKSLAAGPKLKVIAHKLDDVRTKTKKSSEELCKVLQQPLETGGLSCAIELAILAGQQAQNVLFKTNTPHLKVLSSLYDSLIGCIVHLIDLLSLQFTDHKIFSSKLLPPQPIISLKQDYGLPIHLIMCIVRPGIDIGGFDNLITQFKSITEECEIPIELYTVFWSLSLTDIKTSEEQYIEEIKTLRDISEKQNGEKKQKIQNQINELEVEQSFLRVAHTYFYTEIKKRAILTANPNLASQLVQKCIYPRLMCSPVDAMYCVSFIETMQKLRIPEFPTMQLISECVSQIIPCIYCCSEAESQNMGLFAFELFTLLSRWTRVFDKECKGTPGFSQIPTQANFISQFQELQTKISVNLCTALKGNSHIVQKNALYVLWKILAEFPTTKQLASDIMVSVSPLKDSELDDLKLLALSYYEQLEKKFAVKPSPSKTLPPKEESRKRSASPHAEKPSSPRPQRPSPKRDQRRDRQMSPGKKTPRSPGQRVGESKNYSGKEYHKFKVVAESRGDKRRENDSNEELPKKRYRDREESDRNAKGPRKEPRRERNHDHDYDDRKHDRGSDRHESYKRKYPRDSR